MAGWLVWTRAASSAWLIPARIRAARTALPAMRAAKGRLWPRAAPEALEGVERPATHPVIPEMV